MNEKQVLETKNNKREASGTKSNEGEASGTKSNEREGSGTKSNERGEPENKKQWKGSIRNKKTMREKHQKWKNKRGEQNNNKEQRTTTHEKEMINKFQKQKEIIENNKIIRSKSYLGSSVVKLSKKRRRIEVTLKSENINWLFISYKGNCKHFFQIYQNFEQNLRILLALYCNFNFINEDVR